MNHFFFGFIFVLCNVGIVLNGQDLLHKPIKNPDMPEWAELLYQEPVSLIKVDAAYKEYYQTHPFKKDHYTRYYKRLLMQNRMNTDCNGTIDSRRWEEAELLNKKIQIKPRNMPEWKDIEMETFWLEKPTEACPWQVNVYAIDLCKSNPSFLIAASETGGIYQSKNKGLQWTQIAKEYQLNTKAIAIHPKSTDTVFIGVSGAIRRSTDGGHHWTTVYSLQDLWVHDFEIVESQPNIVLAATSKGMYRSINSGQDWVQIFNTSSTDVKTNPVNQNILYATRFNTSAGYYEPVKSTDGGKSFFLKNSGWHNLKDGGVRLAICPSDKNRIYAIVLTNDRGPYLMRSDNEGESWSIISKGSYSGYNSPEFPMDNWQGFYDLAIFVSPQNANHVITGTGSIFKSTDGGSSFKIHGGYGGNFSVHPDFQCAVAIGNDSWIGTDGGLTYSSDFFTEVKNSSARNKGLNGSDFWGFDVGWSNKTITGGRYHNGNTIYAPDFNKYIRMGGAEQATGYIHPIRNLELFYSDIGAYQLNKNSDSSFQWSSVPCAKFPNESYYPMEFSKMIWSPYCYSTVFLGEKNSLWVSDNNGASFQSLFSLPESDSWVEDIEISRSNPLVIYITERNNRIYDGQIWRSTDGGKSFIKLTNPGTTTGGMRRVKAIAISDVNDQIIFQALRTGNAQNKVFKSTDGGQTWTNLTSVTISGFNISDIVYQSGTDDGVYIACDGGNIFYRNNQMTDWELHGTGLSLSHFTRSLKPYYRGGKLINGSNMGVWEIDFFEKSKPVAQPSVDKLSSYCSRDTFYFEDYSSLHFDGSQEWEWSFPGALYISDSRSGSPRVVYPGPGKYDVSLKIKNRNGVSEKRIESMIEIYQSICNKDSVAGKSLDLGGRSNALTIPKIPTLQNAEGFSVMAWIKLNKKQDCFTQIISNWGSNVGFGFGFAFQGYVPTTNLTFFWKGVPYQLTSSFNLDTLVWTHVAMVVYKDSVRLYRDGVSWTRRGDFSGFDLSSTPWEVGKGVPGQCGDFDGEMEELKIFNRSLSETEIRKNMHLIEKHENGLVAYYQFNEHDPKVFYDRIGLAHAANGAAGSKISSAPVSAGISESIKSPQIGWNLFPQTGFGFWLSNSSTTGEVYNYRLNEAPFPYPETIFAPFSPVYWISRVWNTNLTTDSVRFFDAFDFDQNASQQISRFQLHSRKPANSHFQSWNVEGPSNQIVHADRSIYFSKNLNLQSQFILSVPDILLHGNDLYSDNSELFIWPNPSTGIFKIWNSGESKNMHFYSSEGKLLQSFILNQESEINISTLSSGIYFLRCKNEYIKLVKI